VKPGLQVQEAPDWVALLGHADTETLETALQLPQEVEPVFWNSHEILHCVGLERFAT
jgi:hypothetical protein